MGFPFAICFHLWHWGIGLCPKTHGHASLPFRGKMEDSMSTVSTCLWYKGLKNQAECMAELVRVRHGSVALTVVFKFYRHLHSFGKMCFDHRWLAYALSRCNWWWFSYSAAALANARVVRYNWSFCKKKRLSQELLFQCMRRYTTVAPCTIWIVLANFLG